MLWTIVQKLDLMKFQFHTLLYGFDMATRRMGLKHVEAFRAVFVTGSMTQAAQRMHTSQPQISRLIGQLEAITQFPLFDRSGGRLRPTVDGSRFFQEVEKTFIGLAGLEASAASIRSFGMGRLSVAAMPRLAGGLLTRIAARFKMDYPHVMISIRSGTASAVHDWISSGLCDIGLAMLYGEVAGVHVEPVLKTRCVAIMPKAHRLAQKKTLRPADFADEAFISFATGVRSTIASMQSSRRRALHAALLPRPIWAHRSVPWSQPASASASSTRLPHTTKAPARLWSRAPSTLSSP